MVMSVARPWLRVTKGASARPSRLHRNVQPLQ